MKKSFIAKQEMKDNISGKEELVSFIYLGCLEFRH